MASTSASLLDRLRKARANSPDWSKLNDIYLPLIKCWLARISGTREESDDLAQEVLVVLVRELRTFEPRGKGSFRAWLRQITVNKARAFFKSRRNRPLAGLGRDEDDFLSKLEDPNSDLVREWDREHDRHVSQKLLELVKNDFEPTTWDAFRRFALDAMPASQVAAELGISENAVLLSKSRVLKRLRREAGDFLT
jgi:RNA polymerase sigma-70 factor (ECF subfamily)